METIYVNLIDWEFLLLHVFVVHYIELFFPLIICSLINGLNTNETCQLPRQEIHNITELSQGEMLSKQCIIFVICRTLDRVRSRMKCCLLLLSKQKFI